MRRPGTRGFLAVGLLVALLVAGFGSYYASSHPDGLEYVAERTGFLEAAEEPRTADSPFADYSTEGVDDPRLGGGIAGVVGVTLTLVLMGGLAMVVRRRGSGDAEDTEGTEDTDDDGPGEDRAADDDRTVGSGH